jgi:hypothetical protein
MNEPEGRVNEHAQRLLGAPAPSAHRCPRGAAGATPPSDVRVDPWT